MSVVKVSEKTLDELKKLKNKERIKTLDGAIRCLLNRPTQLKDIKSAGAWPTNALADINNARIELLFKMRFPTDCPNVRVYLPTLLQSSLDNQLTMTEITWRKFFIINNLATIHEWEHLEDDTAVVRSEDHEVKIINVKVAE